MGCKSRHRLRQKRLEEEELKEKDLSLPHREI